MPAHPAIFESLHVPEAVWSEVVGSNRIPLKALSKSKNIQRHTLSQNEVSQFIEAKGLAELHFGERECLYLCGQLNVLLILTDDLAVREAAKKLNLTAVGSLGIVAKAYALGRISLSEAESHIRQLHEVSTLFVTKAIVEMAMEQLRKLDRTL